MVDERDPNTENPNVDDPNADQEYNYPEEESREFGANPHSGGTENLMSLLKNKRILTVVGGIFGLYILLHLFGSDDEIVPVEQPVAVSAPVEPMTPVAVEAAPMPLFAALDKASAETEKSHEDIEKLKTQVSAFNRQTVDFRNRVKELDAKVSSLVKQMDSNNEKLTLLLDKDAKKVSATPKIKKEDYRVRAIISGRAWVEDDAGNNITVKLGDRIATYGRVTEIKPVEGVVVTSSGRVISFEAADD